jgi:hypothetical protein
VAHGLAASWHRRDFKKFGVATSAFASSARKTIFHGDKHDFTRYSILHCQCTRCYLVVHAKTQFLIAMSAAHCKSQLPPFLQPVQG